MFNFRYIEDKESFHGTGKKGLGASNMPCLAGYMQKYTREVNGKRVPYTPYVLWLEKTGRIPGFKGNEATYWGNRLEGMVMGEFIKRKNIPGLCAKMKTEFVHPNYSWAISHPDLVLVNMKGEFREVIQEIKTGSFFGTRRRDNPDYGYSQEDFSASGIPASVYVQVQWQLFTSDIQQAGVSILMDTSKYREYGPITYNKDVIQELLARGEKFWWYVKNDKEPTPESYGDVQLIWPEVNDLSATVAGEIEAQVLAMIEQDRKLKKAIDKMKGKRDEIKNAIGIFIGENKLLTGADGSKLASQSVFNRDSLSLKKLKDEHPWLYKRVKRYIKTMEVRRLTF